MDIILIPGLWLDASSWDDIVPVLRRAGHSGGGAIAHAAADARPERVARVVYVASVGVSA
jgi:pimeloyl-ACP methyl ester carboxylesterase